VVLYAEKLEQMHAWYLRVLDAHVVHENPWFSSLTMRGSTESPSQILRESAQAYDPGSTGELPHTGLAAPQAPVARGPLAALAGPPTGPRCRASAIVEFPFDTAHIARVLRGLCYNTALASSPN
jgi:hypothetical protein